MATIARTIATSSGSDGDVPDEGLVDLDVVHGEALEVGQTGVAGAEVVDRRAARPSLHQAQRAPRSPRGRAGDQHALGDLQLEQLGREAGCAEGAAATASQQIARSGTGAQRR